MIPASLVVVLTITLAGGTRAMVARNVIVRKLDSLEALGAVTDICSDKTGTLTQGASLSLAERFPKAPIDLLMHAQARWLSAPPGSPLAVPSTSRVFRALQPDHRRAFVLDHLARRVGRRCRPEEARGRVDRGRRGVAGAKQQARPQPRGPSDLIKDGGEPLSTLLNVASMCSTAKVFKKEGEGWTARGDPTECAIQTFAHRFDWGRERWVEGDSPEWSTSPHPFCCLA